MSSGEVTPLSLRADPATPHTFVGHLSLPQVDRPTKASLVVTENQGRDALKRPQRIPFLIPAAAEEATTPTEEAWTYGVNDSLLKTIAQVSAGEYNPQSGKNLLQSGALKPNKIALWPWLLAVAVVLYLLQIWLARVYA